eukprot:9491101-Pyramimonas_sp.AAC.1
MAVGCSRGATHSSRGWPPKREVVARDGRAARGPRPCTWLTCPQRLAPPRQSCPILPGGYGVRTQADTCDALPGGSRDV